MKFQMKALVAAAALVATGASNAGMISNSDTDSSFFVSIWNATDEISTVFDTGLTLTDFRNGNSPANQTWQLDLSGLNINQGDTVYWMAAASREVADANFGALSTASPAMTTANFNFGDINPFGPTSKWRQYADNFTGLAVTPVNSTAAVAGEQYGVFTPADGQPYAGDFWGNNWGGSFTNFDAGNGLDVVSALFLASTTDGSSFPADTLGVNIELTSNGQLIIGSGASQVPVPAAAWLFGSGLLGMVGVARRRRG
jgi:hypothetical protein